MENILTPDQAGVYEKRRLAVDIERMIHEVVRSFGLNPQTNEEYRIGEPFDFAFISWEALLSKWGIVPISMTDIPDTIWNSLAPPRHSVLFGLKEYISQIRSAGGLDLLYADDLGSLCADGEQAWGNLLASLLVHYYQNKMAGAGRQEVIIPNVPMVVRGNGSTLGVGAVNSPKQAQSSKKRCWSTLTLQVSFENEWLEYSFDKAPIEKCDCRHMKLTTGDFEMLKALALTNGDGSQGLTLGASKRKKFERLNKKLCSFFEIEDRAIIGGKVCFKISRLKTENEAELEQLTWEQKRDDWEGGSTNGCGL